MGGTLRISYSKNLSMRYIKLAQKTTGAKISAFSLKFDILRVPLIQISTEFRLNTVRKFDSVSQEKQER
jgi:hypothetical protein